MQTGAGAGAGTEAGAATGLTSSAPVASPPSPVAVSVVVVACRKEVRRAKMKNEVRPAFSRTL